MIDLIVHKQNEEIKQRLGRLEEKVDAILNYFEFGGVIKYGEGMVAVIDSKIPEGKHQVVHEEWHYIKGQQPKPFSKEGFKGDQAYTMAKMESGNPKNKKKRK